MKEMEYGRDEAHACVAFCHWIKLLVVLIFISHMLQNSMCLH